MQYISATDAKQNFGALLDNAQRQPQVIKKQNREVAAMVSMEDYELIKRLSADSFAENLTKMAEHAQQKGMTEEILDEILADIS